VTNATEISRRSLLATGFAAAVMPLLPRAAAAQDVCSTRLTPIKARPERAVSLREVSAALSAGKLARFEGLTRLDGFTLDADNQDIIVWGLAERGKPELQVEDFVVALRSAFLKGVHDGTDYSKSAAISIDSDPSYFAQLDKYQTSNPQGRQQYLQACRQSDWRPVRVDGMIRHSRTASVLVEADYRMKRTAQGVLKLPIRAPFTSDFDASISEWRSAIASGRDPSGVSGSITRYWFMPGRFNHVASTDGKTFFLDYAQVVLRDEDEKAQAGGGKVSTGRVDPYARAFTCAWTARMEEIYEAEPIWRQMHNMYRNFAVARVMSDNDTFDKAGFDPAFLLERYQVPRVDVPDTIPGSGRVEIEVKSYKGGKTTYARSTCGGVDVGFNKSLEVNPDTGGETLNAGRSVVASRPTRTVLAWAITPGALPAQSTASPTGKGGGLLDDTDSIRKAPPPKAGGMLDD
jgi:hypothetical protein